MVREKVKCFFFIQNIYKKRFVICNPELLNPIPVFEDYYYGL